MINERTIAADLLSISAVFLRPENPFTWASGIKSPIYCDNRLTLSAPRVREHVEQGLAALIKEYYPQAQALMGTSTAGIAHAAITATILDLPMGYVRSEAKTHGRTNRIEGKLEPGTKVVVVEDLISTGGSGRSAGHRQHIHIWHAERSGQDSGRRYRKPFSLQPGCTCGGCRRGRLHTPSGQGAHHPFQKQSK